MNCGVNVDSLPIHTYPYPLWVGSYKGEMMKKVITYAAAMVAALSFGHMAAAQEAAAPAAAPVFEVKNWYFRESIDVNALKDNGGTFVGLNQTLGFDIMKDVTVDFNVPVYAQNGYTSVANLMLGANWAAFKGNNSVLGDWMLNFGGGFYIPVGTEYFRNANVNPFVNTKFGFDLWKFDFAQTVDYRFNGGESYITWLGAKTDSDVLTLVSDLSYAWNAWNFGLQFDQLYYVNSGEYQLFLGPVASWEVASNVSFDAAILIPVAQQVTSAESNAFVKAGIEVKF